MDWETCNKLLALEQARSAIRRGGSRTSATSKMELFVIIVDSFQLLTIITKRFILDTATVVDPLLIRATQISMMVLLAKLASNIYLKKSSIIAKRLVLVAWLGPGYDSTDLYITVLNIETWICNNGRQAKMESF